MRSRFDSGPCHRLRTESDIFDKIKTMKLKTKLILGIAGLAILSLLSWQIIQVKEKGLLLTETLSAEVQQTAKDGLLEFFGSDDEGILQAYNIESFEKMRMAVLGKAYLLYTIEDLNQLKNYSEDQAISSLITPTQTWFFAVLIDNEFKAYLHVEWYQGRWQAIGTTKSYGKEINQLESELPRLLKEKGITGEHSFKWVDLHSINVSFLFVEAGGKEFIVPLTPTGWFGLENKKLYFAKEAMPGFVEAAKRIPKNPDKKFR